MTATRMATIVGHLTINQDATVVRAQITYRPEPRHVGLTVDVSLADAPDVLDEAVERLKTQIGLHHYTSHANMGGAA